MAREKRKSAQTLRSWLIRRFIITTVIVVAAVLALVTLEDFVFARFIAFATDTPRSDLPGQVLHLGYLLLTIPVGDDGISLLVKSLLTVLFILLVALVLLPIVVGATLFARSAERRVVAEQKARDEEREQLYARRNLMISDMAHDLRTPVMSISGLSQALADGMVDDPETQRRYLNSINAKAEKMGDLVTMLFDFVKLESEGFELDRVPLDLPQLMLQEAAALYTDVEDAGMVLRIEVPEEPLSVVADRQQLGRVVANLIGNAMRHNAPGTTIVLGLNQRAGVADIIVADNGRPIEADVEELFEPFAREDAARSGGGSGLGLSIVKTIVDMHGYEIALVQPYGAYTKAFIVTCAIEG